MLEFKGMCKSIKMIFFFNQGPLKIGNILTKCQLCTHLCCKEAKHLVSLLKTSKYASVFVEIMEIKCLSFELVVPLYHQLVIVAGREQLSR